MPLPLLPSLLAALLAASPAAAAPPADDFLTEATRQSALSPEEAAWRASETAEPYVLRAEALARALDLVQRYPGRVVPERIGRTVQGRSIWGFRVADPSVPVQRSMLVFASIHALEWISTEVALAFLEQSAERPPPGVELFIVPILNVDGRARAERDMLEGDRRAYRRANGNGVDLNRNFSVHTEPRAIWRHVIPGYYSMPETPLSEPEAQAIDRLGQRGFDVAVSLHAFGGYHFLPWTGAWKRAEDWPALLALGTAMQDGQGRGAYRPMQLSRWAFFFRGHGMEIDHLYGTYGTPSVLVELTRSGLARPADLKTPFRWYNPRDPQRHRDLGTDALRAVAWEMAWALRTGQETAW